MRELLVPAGKQPARKPQCKDTCSACGTAVTCEFPVRECCWTPAGPGSKMKAGVCSDPMTDTLNCG